jgi:hypothetical protein
MGKGCNQQNGARTMQLAHEVATRARRTIQNWNNKLRLKEIEAALLQGEQEAPDENFEDDLSLDRVTAIYPTGDEASNGRCNSCHVLGSFHRTVVTWSENLQSSSHDGYLIRFSLAGFQ